MSSDLNLMHTVQTTEIIHHEDSTSSTFAVRLCLKGGLEYSMPVSDDEILDDTEDSGNEIVTGFG
ncbi:hypothetical protein C1H46_015711 [Malus baccata]|uniref:Uncharacterized protein n=1 Tax=Malus baccata TaxID=106549 RepID=A0A540MIS9_MALBA|nr:hypothetical protein C1H46_015711 [Malus baccata]